MRQLGLFPPALLRSYLRSPVKDGLLGVVLIAVALGVAVLLVHGNALRGWWRVDDPAILLFVVDNPSPHQYFFSPERWQLLGNTFFTPWLILDFWVDYELLGAVPAGFYLHNLLMLWLAAFLTFLLLRKHVGQSLGAAAVLLFLFGAPVVVIAQQLMSRHYIIGLVFMLLCVLLFRKSSESGRYKWALLSVSAVLYLAASLAKEIYAPLPMVLIFLASGSAVDRLRDISPYAIAALIFIVWRGVMLGEWVGGYGGGLSNSLGDVLQSGWIVAGNMFGRGAGLWVVSALVVLASFASFRFDLRHGVVGVAAVAGVLLPFFALDASPGVSEYRFAFLPWWLFCVLFAIAVELSFRGVSKRGRAALAVSLFLLVGGVVAGNGWSARGEYAAMTSSFDVQGPFLWNHSDDVGYVPGGAVSWTLQFPYGVSSLKQRVLGERAPRPAPTIESSRWFLGELPVFSYDPVHREMMQVEQSALSSGSSYCRGSAPMTVDFERRASGLKWSIEASGATECAFFFPDLNAVSWLPCSGEIFYRPPHYVWGDVRFFVKMSDGSWSVTPLLSFPDRPEVLSWRGAGESCEPVPGL